MLLRKLVEISEGKMRAVATADAARVYVDRRVLGRSTATISASRQVYLGAGTNMINRRNETNRIERDNQLFAKRLFTKSSCVTKRSLDADYQKHLQYASLHKKKPAFGIRPKSRIMFRETPRRAIVS